MTNKLRNQIKKKNALYFRSIKTNSIEVKNKYTTRKNKLLSDLKNAEIEYFSIELEMNKSDISKRWNALMKRPGFCDIRNSCYVFCQ